MRVDSPSNEMYGRGDFFCQVDSKDHPGCARGPWIVPAAKPARTQSGSRLLAPFRGANLGASFPANYFGFAGFNNKLIPRANTWNMRRKDRSSASVLGLVAVLAVLTVIDVFIAPCPAGAQQLSIRGSDTLIYLGQRFSAIYSRTTPDVRVDVQGGGWTQAVNAIASGQADIAQVENDPPSAVPSDVIAFPIGVQAIVVYVNQSNPVRDLTIGQLRSIFLGEITNWKSLGGPDEAILLFAGESTTGTLAYFQESVLRGQEPYPFVGKVNTKALLEEIASHPHAIGYGSLAAGPGTRALNIKFGRTSLPISPNEETIRARKYPITRHVSWAVRRHRDARVDALCRWTLSSEGQLVVEASGFEPLLPDERRTALTKLGAGTEVKSASMGAARKQTIESKFKF